MYVSTHVDQFDMILHDDNDIPSPEASTSSSFPVGLGKEKRLNEAWNDVGKQKGKREKEWNQRVSG